MTILDGILFGSLIAAVLLMGLRFALLGGDPDQKVRLLTPVGPANFDFTKSFASIITAVGALLTTFLAAKGIVTAQKPHLTPADYALLSVFFAALVAVAPVAFGGLSKTMPVVNPQAPHDKQAKAADPDGKDAKVVANDVQSQGYAIGFLIAGTLTVWGVLGQLGTMLTFATDVQAATEFTALFVSVIALGMVLVAIYVWRSIYAVLTVQVKRHAHRAALISQSHMAGLSEREIADVKKATEGGQLVPLPHWRML